MDKPKSAPVLYGDFGVMRVARLSEGPTMPGDELASVAVGWASLRAKISWVAEAIVHSSNDLPVAQHQGQSARPVHRFHDHTPDDLMRHESARLSRLADGFGDNTARSADAIRAMHEAVQTLERAYREQQTGDLG